MRKRSWTVRGRPAWTIRKNDCHAELRCTLLAFYEPTYSTDEFTESRLRFYEQFDKMFVLRAWYHADSITFSCQYLILYI